MTFEQIYTTIIAALPSIVAVVTSIISVVKLIKNNRVSNQEVFDKFEETRQAVLDTKEMEELKRLYVASLEENRELKKLLKKLLTQMTKIEQEEEE